jgi:AAA domain/Bifunctional DNA primase/polymerase, N-terminal
MPATFFEGTMLTSDPTATRLALRAAGFHPIPLNGKRPQLNGWSAKVDASFTEIEHWARQFPQCANTGILTQTTPTLDADIRHEEAAAAVEELTREWFDGRGSVLVRFGQAPKRAIPFRTRRPFSKLKKKFIAPDGSEHSLEFLGNGQQVVVDGVHPDTQRPYAWHGGYAPGAIAWNDLPEIDEAEARSVLDFAAEMLAEKFSFRETELDPQPLPDRQADNGPLDVEACLASMQPNGESANSVQSRVILSLLQKGIHPEDVLTQVVDATMAVADQAGLGWTREKEEKKAYDRIKSDVHKLTMEYRRTGASGIPPWLAGEFHAGWWRVLQEGDQPQLMRNAHKWYVRAEPNYSAKGVANTAEPQARQEAGPAPAPKKYKFPLVSFADLRPGTEPNYLVDELIPVAGLVVIYGAPKSGKSFWTFDLFMHVTLGWEYRDRAVQQGPVIYCAFEGAHGYRKRGEAFRRHHCLTDETPPMYVIPGRADLIKEHKHLIQDMRDQLQDLGVTVPPRAVVLDTLNKSLIGSESKDVDMANYIAAAEAIQKEFSCVVIIVHHHGIEESRPRGHTSLRGAVDTQIKIVRDDQNNIIAEIEDMRDGPEGAQVVSRLVVVTVGEDKTGKSLTSAAVEPVDGYSEPPRSRPKLSKNQQTMLSILKEAGPQGLSVDEWNAKAREAGLAKRRHATLVDLRAELKEKGLVTARNGIWTIVAEPRRDL